MSGLYGATVVTFFFTPVLISSFKYPAPMEIPFLKGDNLVNYLINYSTQTLVQASILILMGVDLTLFVIFSFHIIYESYLIKKVCLKLGEDEAKSFIEQNLNVRKTSGSFDFYEEFMLKDLGSKDIYKSSELIKIILEHHKDLLK